MRSPAKVAIGHPKINKLAVRTEFKSKNRGNSETKKHVNPKERQSSVSVRKQNKNRVRGIKDKFVFDIKRLSFDVLDIKPFSIDVSLPPRLISVIESNKFSSVSYSDHLHFISPNAIKFPCSKLKPRKQKKTTVKEIETKGNSSQQNLVKVQCSKGKRKRRKNTIIREIKPEECSILKIENISDIVSLSSKLISSPVKKVKTVQCSDLNDIQVTSLRIYKRPSHTLSCQKQVLIKEINDENVCKIKDVKGGLSALSDMFLSQSSLKVFGEKSAKCRRKNHVCDEIDNLFKKNGISHSPTLSVSDSGMSYHKRRSRRSAIVKLPEKKRGGVSHENLRLTNYMAALSDIEYQPSICLIDCFQFQKAQLNGNFTDCTICMKDMTSFALQGITESEQVIKATSNSDGDYDVEEKSFDYKDDHNFEQEFPCNSSESHRLNFGASGEKVTSFISEMEMYDDGHERENIDTSYKTAECPSFMSEKRILCQPNMLKFKESQTYGMDDNIKMFRGLEVEGHKIHKLIKEEHITETNFQNEFLYYLSSQFS